MTARRLAAVCVVVAVLALSMSRWPASAQSKTTSTTSPEQTVTTAVAPGETAPNGGPLLVPGEVSSGSDASGTATSNSDNTGTVVALVISGLLVVALLLALLTYWFWRNTRPGRPVTPSDEED